MKEEEELWVAVSDKCMTWSHRAVSLDYLKLAEAAVRCDKTKLAKRLLRLEKDVRRKLDLLVMINDHREALVESVRSGHPEEGKTVGKC